MRHEQPALLADIARAVAAVTRPPRTLDADPIDSRLGITEHARPPHRSARSSEVAGPVAAALTARLARRLCLAAGQVRLALRGVAAALANAPERRARFARTLDLLADDDATTLVFGQQLALGWRHFVAAVDELPVPALPDEPALQRGRALWSAWSQRARGSTDRAPVEELPPGYILRVA